MLRKGLPSLRKPSVPEMGPGAMVLTLTPLGPHSTARCLVIASADTLAGNLLHSVCGYSSTITETVHSPFAALAEPACTWRPCPLYPSVAEMLTMLPPWFYSKTDESKYNFCLPNADGSLIYCRLNGWLKILQVSRTYLEPFLIDHLAGVECTHRVYLHHCLEGVEGERRGWAEEVPCSICPKKSFEM